MAMFCFTIGAFLLGVGIAVGFDAKGLTPIATILLLGGGALGWIALLLSPDEETRRNSETIRTHVKRI